MGGAQAFCNLKQQVVVIPCPGWHCKDVSMLNCHPVQDVIANGEGSTGVTWTGLCGFTAQHKPAIVFGEKVRALIGDRYLHPLIVRTAELGYCCLWQLVNGMHYGLPQDRLRVYVILVSAEETLRLTCAIYLIHIERARVLVAKHHAVASAVSTA